uniref:BTB domain-containing protein n=1 Tax=Meloidogyne incognita TaxID=6306 RepID=A0A914NI29_MELIC
MNVEIDSIELTDPVQHDSDSMASNPKINHEMKDGTKSTDFEETVGTNGILPKSRSWIKLNVGGKLFMTTIQTLCRESGSFLARLSQEDRSLPSEKDESGFYLIDRDSDYFSSVLNYLRHGKVILDHGLSEEGLREEAEFYNLPKLIALCKERIADRERQRKSLTLCRESGSFLARLSQEDRSLPSEKDESGFYLIDRDSDYFSSVLNYLRHGKVILDHGLSEEGLREEAEFYNLPKLIALCKERIADRERQRKSLTKHVYRVLQCHEDELTNVISAMSDGWKFEQLVPIGQSSHPSESGQPEYLCVVSREYPVSANDGQNNEAVSDRAQFLQMKAMNG